MESLVPSEIARLVYGYLIDENCEASAQLFLETSSCLKECLKIHKKGRKFNTSVLGLSLVDLLNLYTDAVCLVKNYLERKDSLNKSLGDFVKELSNILVIDNESSNNIAKTVFLRISVPNKINLGKNSENVDINDDEEDEETDKEGQNEPNKDNEAKQKSGNQPEQKSSCQNEPTKTITETDETTHSKSGSNDDFDLNMLQALLDNTALHERIAENINKAIDTNGEASNEKTDEKKIIDTIVTNTEADPIFHELLEELVGPRAEQTTTPEDTDRENGDPLEDRQASALHTGLINPEVPDDETMKKIAEESNLAIEGILAGNKQMQHDVIIPDLNVPIAPKPTETVIISQPQQMQQDVNIPEVNIPIALKPNETVIISKPQLVATSSGMYQQGFIIPAGYRITDVIPITQVQGSSTPFRLPTNISPLGHLSPISAPQLSVSKSSANTRSVRQPRRRRVLPKSETFIIEVPGQNDTVQEVQVEIPASPKSISGPDAIKRSRVRTRGGLQKVGTRGIRGIKAVAPQQIQSTNTIDQNIQVIYQADNLIKPNTCGIKTRSMAKTLQTRKKEPKVDCSETVPVKNKHSEEPELEENPIKNISDPVVEKNNTKCSKEETDGTPEQQILVTKPRVSLSTPRRSHVRTLDFTTPVKELTVKRSLTSPKVYHHKKNESLELVKRGIGFNTPLKTISEENEKVEVRKKKKDWDADLRNFTSAPASMDIPTSVGLKRKNASKKDKVLNGKKKGPKKKLTKKEVTKKVLKKKTSNDELVNQIEKEVKDVVGEELLLNSSITSEMGNLIEQKLAEELDKNDSMTAIETHGNLVDNPQDKPAEHLTSEETVMSTQTSENVFITVDDNNTESQRNEEDDKTNDNKDKEENSNPEVAFSTSTPLKIAMSPVHENSRGQLTPTTKIVMSHLGKGNLNYPSVFSPSSQGSLENILIKECSRMETEKAMRHLSQDIKKLDSPTSDTASCNTSPLNSAKNIGSNASIVPNKELTFESACKSIFETPAKLLSAPVPPGTPVEMTPLTKVLASETSFSKTVLVTPTLPPTPKHPCSLETPHKTDENPISTSASSSDSSKVVEENSISPKKQQEIVNNDNFKDHLPEMNKGSNKSPNSLIGSSDNSDKHSPQNNESLNKSNEIKPLISIKTPQIKLKSPKLDKTTLSNVLSKKKKKNVPNTKPQENDSPEHKTDNVTSKATLEQNLSSQLEEELNISSHSEQSNQNTNIEVICKKKTCSKQTQSETKKRIVPKQNKKLSCPDQNKKQTIINSTKVFTKSKVREEMETEIRHLLKDTKAKLFGPDNSSDSDSDSGSSSDSASDISTKCKKTSGPKKANAQWKTARERLQKLDNVKMLESSSTSDDSSESESVPRHDTFVDKQSTHMEANLELNPILRKNDDKSSLKQFDVPNNSTEPTKDSRTIIKETEESFPTLHLSEESNQSLKSNNHLSEPSKLKKSSGGNDPLVAAKVSSLLVNSPPLKPLAKQLVKNVNKETSVLDQINTNKPSTSKDEDKVSDQANNSGHQQFHLNEPVSHTSRGNETLKSKISDSSEKLDQSQSQTVSEYLDNYVFTFSLNDDKSGNYLTKELRTSQFFSIFDLAKNSVVPQYNKITPSRTELISCTRSHSKNSKRPRSVSSSEDEDEIRSRTRDRVYRSYRGGRGLPYRGHRKASFHGRRSFFFRDRYSQRSYDSRHRDYDHYSTYDRKRPRHESPEPRRSSKKEDRRKLKEKMYSTRFDRKSHSYDSRYSSINDVFVSSKSGSEVDGKQADLNSTYSSERTAESRGCSTSSQRLSIVVDDEPIYLKPKPLPLKRSKPETDREDGELSDSSVIKRISSEANEKHLVLSLGADDSRATLLKKVDLDHFLSLVHGNEK